MDYSHYYGNGGERNRRGAASSHSSKTGSGFRSSHLDHHRPTYKSLFPPLPPTPTSPSFPKSPIYRKPIPVPRSSTGQSHGMRLPVYPKRPPPPRKDLIDDLEARYRRAQPEEIPGILADLPVPDEYAPVSKVQLAHLIKQFTPPKPKAPEVDDPDSRYFYDQDLKSWEEAKQAAIERAETITAPLPGEIEEKRLYREEVQARNKRAREIKRDRKRAEEEEQRKIDEAYVEKLRRQKLADLKDDLEETRSVLESTKSDLESTRNDREKDKKKMKRFEERLEQEVTCIICSSVMVAPHQIVPCGHVMCGLCGVQWLHSQAEQHQTPSCPMCREHVTPGRPLMAVRPMEGIIGQFVEAKMERGNWDGYEDFLERQEEWQAWKQVYPEILRPDLFPEARDNRHADPSTVQTRNTGQNPHQDVIHIIPQASHRTRQLSLSRSPDIERLLSVSPLPMPGAWRRWGHHHREMDEVDLSIINALFNQSERYGSAIPMARGPSHSPRRRGDERRTARPRATHGSPVQAHLDGSLLDSFFGPSILPSGTRGNGSSLVADISGMFDMMNERFGMGTSFPFGGGGRR